MLFGPRRCVSRDDDAGVRGAGFTLSVGVAALRFGAGNTDRHRCTASVVGCACDTVAGGRAASRARLQAGHQLLARAIVVLPATAACCNRKHHRDREEKSCHAHRYHTCRTPTQYQSSTFFLCRKLRGECFCALARVPSSRALLRNLRGHAEEDETTTEIAIGQPPAAGPAQLPSGTSSFDAANCLPNAKHDYDGSMSLLSRMVLALLPVLCIGGCKSTSDIAELRRIADKVCACNDFECVTNVAATARDEVPDEVLERLMSEHSEEFQEIMKQLLVCGSEVQGEGNLPAEMPFLPNQAPPDIPPQQ